MNHNKMFLARRYYNLLENVHVLVDFYKESNDILLFEKYWGIWYEMFSDLEALELGFKSKELEVLLKHMEKHRSVPELNEEQQ